ncbi:MAG: PHP domain-containing protein [Lamprobacter sp.]|uniref:PHP domain-containing protein n=1 Tax=Lamprobacter sp. TaxID=3100796 RepID=UPI002B25818E|nr:PHP domain-containing protein [Lamprobacter sp.]MEA3641047.1 PHP domain-containing protein [Lamprobacter sp.]
MMKTPDLHTHSTASDGTLAPRDLIERAAQQGVEVLALTDHDTLAGLDEASEAAHAQGLSLVPGVEISVTWGGRTIHIVGLDVDPACAVLGSGLAGLRGYREQRAIEIAARLERVGWPGALEGARALASGELVGRTHFARFLVQRGAAKDLRSVFKHFLVKGKPGHVAGQWTTLEEAVGWIRAAGGQAVIAHPARYGLTRSKMKRLLDDFRAFGGRGIEVVSGSHSRDDYFTFARWAREQGLLASAGSDYHGPESPWIELGRLPALPEGCKPIWEQPGFAGLDQHRRVGTLEPMQARLSAV